VNTDELFSILRSHRERHPADGEAFDRVGALLGLPPLHSNGSAALDKALNLTASTPPPLSLPLRIKAAKASTLGWSADLYALSGARAVATLYSDATTATTSPAVSLVSVGTSGGQAAAFTYDLPQSVVYSRQGNPAWEKLERDTQTPIRSDDLYFGGSSTDWVNLGKAAIPQADEQQRLLGQLILNMNADRKPLPRFWYLPRDLKAVVVMTGDDHATGGTAGRLRT